MTQKQETSLPYLPPEILHTVAGYLQDDPTSTALAGTMSRRWYEIFTTRNRKLNRHSRVWGSIFPPKQWNSNIWNKYCQDGPLEAQNSYELALIGRDLKYIYNADELEMPKGIEPLHLMLIVLGPDGGVTYPSFPLRRLLRPEIKEFNPKTGRRIKIKLHYYDSSGMNAADLWKITGTTTFALFCKSGLDLHTIKVDLTLSSTYEGEDGWRNRARPKQIRYLYKFEPCCRAQLMLKPKRGDFNVALKGLLPAPKLYEPEGEDHLKDMIEYIKRAEIIETYERKLKK